MPSQITEDRRWPHDPASTIAVDWADGFRDAFPDIDAPFTVLSVWFLAALEAGYDAGRAQAPYPELVEGFTLPPDD